MKDGRKILLKYSIAIAIVLAAAAFLMWRHDLLGAETLARRFHVLSDAFTVPGVLMTMAGVLVWVSNFGLFDMLGYAGGRVGAMFIPVYKKYDHQTFYDYKEGRKGKRISGYSFMFIVGLASLALGVLFLVLYYVYKA